MNPCKNEMSETYSGYGAIAWAHGLLAPVTLKQNTLQSVPSEDLNGETKNQDLENLFAKHHICTQYIQVIKFNPI